MKERQVEQIQNNKLDGVRLKDINIKGKSSLVLKQVINDLRQYILRLKVLLEDRRSRVSELTTRIRELEDELHKKDVIISRRERSLERLPTVKKEAYIKGKEMITEQRRESANYYKNKILRLERRVESVQKPLKAKINKLSGTIDELRARHKKKDMTLYQNRKNQKELKLRVKEMSKEKNRYKALVKKKDKQLENHRYKNKRLREKLYYKPKPRKQRIKTVYVQKPMTQEAKILNRIASNKNVDKRFYNLYDVNMKTLHYCNSNEIKDLNKLFLLLNIFSLETCFKKDIKIPNYFVNINYLTSNGFIDSGTNKMNSRYYFCTPKGIETVKKYKDYISHGKSPFKDS